jgi:hypothetical protein
MSDYTYERYAPFLDEQQARAHGLLASYTQEERQRIGRSGAHPRIMRDTRVISLPIAPHAPTERVTDVSEDQ